MAVNSGNGDEFREREKAINVKELAKKLPHSLKQGLKYIYDAILTVDYRTILTNYYIMFND